jgi:hypothetical protein
MERDIQTAQARIDSFNQSEKNHLERVSEPENKFVNENLRSIAYQADAIALFRGKLENQLSADCIPQAKQRLDMITQNVKSVIANCLSRATTLVRVQGSFILYSIEDLPFYFAFFKIFAANWKRMH